MDAHTKREKNPIVIAVGMKEQRVKGGTIATKKNIDLTKTYEHLRSRGYTSGGHKTVGGFQAVENKTLSQILQDLRNAVKQLQKQI